VSVKLTTVQSSERFNEATRLPIYSNGTKNCNMESNLAPLATALILVQKYDGSGLVSPMKTEPFKHLFVLLWLPSYIYP